MGQLVDKQDEDKIVCPYNLDDTLWYVDNKWWLATEPIEFYVYSIHITKANKRSHIVIIDKYSNARITVPLHKMNGCCFSSYKEGMEYIKSLNSR